MPLLAIFVTAPLAAQPYTQISAGEYHTCALLDSGGVHCWGDNFRGQLGNGMSGSGQEQPEPQRVLGISSAAHIAAGASHNCAALRDGRVRGAALDVYDEEPLPRDHPLRSEPRTLLSPHVAYASDESYREYYEQIVEDIDAWMRGTPLRVL